MPDEKQSGIYGVKRPFDEEEVVESLALDESSRRISSKPIVQQKHMGPQILKTKIKDALSDGGQLLKNRPASQIKNTPAKDDAEDDDEYNNDFEEDAGGDDQLEKLRRALDRENQKAVKHA